MLAVCMAMIDDDEDKEVFRILFDRYKKLMLNTAYDILKNKQDTEDAVQEAFFRIAKNFQIVHKEICPKTANQFVIIVRNISIDIYRKNKRQETLVLNEDVATSDFEQFEASKIKAALNSLKEQDRDILYMHYIHGFSVKEISKLLNIKQDAVYKRLGRARANLKKLIEEGEV
jgi:RNA polymerase sigma-70 factor (ECF subfamily)